MSKKSTLSLFYEKLKSIFLSGLFTILPLTITFALFNFSFKLLKSWLIPIQKFVPIYLQRLPHSEIILVVLSIFALGFVLKFFLLSKIIDYIEEAIFNRIPFLRTIYFGIKQLVDAVSGKDKFNFQNIVFVEFPRQGVYSLGFLTGQLAPEVAPNIEEKLYSIFIPTAPNPTTGFYTVVHEKDFFVVNLTKQEAIAIIISGGIIGPDKFKSSNIKRDIK